MFAASGITEKLESHYLYKLVKLRKSEVRYKHHHDFLTACRRDDVIPDGLKLRKTSNNGTFFPAFEEKWSHILHTASGELRDLIGEEFSSALGVVIRDITELESRITYGFGCSILDKFNDKVQEICDTLQFSLYTRRRTKFNKLALSHGDDTSLGDMVSVDAEKHQPTESQVRGFVSDIRRDVDRVKQPVSVFVEDVGVEENPCDLHPLPVDSPALMLKLSKLGITGVLYEHLSNDVASGEMPTLIDTLAGRTNVTPVIPPSSSSADDSALLLVELTEGQTSRDLTLPLPSQEFSSEVCTTPHESTAENICDELRVECDAPTDGHLGMETCNERVFRDGLQVVVHLSSRVLTPAEMSLLSKGLSFCPTPKEVDMFALKKDMFDFVRRLRLKEYYCGDESVDGDFSDQPVFRKRSTWCPERNMDAIFETYVSLLEKKILSQDLSIRCHRNLFKNEQEAFENLTRYDDIIVKPDDNGSAVVVMYRARYVGEAMRQLGDEDVYLPLSHDPTADMVDIINERVRRLHSDGYISDSTLQFLLINCNARAGRFHLLPKIHKENIPRRPVISGCNTPTEKISTFVDHQLKHLGLPYVQKTKKTATARKTSLRYNERINAQGTQLLFDKRRKVES